MVSGRRTDFDVSPIIKGGTEVSVVIKRNRHGRFEFGPYSREDVTREEEVQANMFDAQEMLNGKKIKILRTSDGQIKASMVLTTSTQDKACLHILGEFLVGENNS